ncbi:MAG: class I SAM-dependent methyltransferase [Methanobrevibacter sp.]|nr:class I SAM-dependent methyltransferase [Candidatus Methanoflexus mossambicus]
MIINKIKEKIKIKSSRFSENPLEDYFYNNNKKYIDKWEHYFDIYHKHFKKFRNNEVTVLEFGVFKGGSLQMWKDYFGKKARIIGVDINPECEKLTEDQIEVYIGDQENRDFLKSLMKKIGPVDVVIEDGGHQMKQQIHTFEEVFPHVKQDGVFLIEDLHTSYWEDYEGGLKKEGTFIEYAKNLIDSINAHWTPEVEINSYTKTVSSMHIYPSIIVFDKGCFKGSKPVQSGICE